MRRPDIKALPSREVLAKLFVYEPDTGTLRWRVRPHVAAKRSPPGSIAGCIGTAGYWRVPVEGRYYYSHRLIWMMQTGAEPEDQIDHANGDKTDNRWANLREADNEKNRRNAKRGKNNRSGIKGVCWVRSHKAWAAYITVNKKQTRLGRFKSISDAAAARARAAEALHGEFARAA